MAKGFNKVVLMGNLTRDPELKNLPSGQSVCEFSLAVNRQWRSQDGSQQEAVDFFDCTAWGKAGEIIAQYMQKGRPLLVSGRLQSRSWETDGQKRSKVEVVVEDFNFVGDGGSGGGAPASERSSAPAAAKKKDDEVVIEDIDDEPVDLSEIPF